MASVDKDGRVSVSLDVLRTVGWWNDEACDVMAEAVRAGTVRVYLYEQAYPLVTRRHADILRVRDPEVRFEQLMALADRYRPLKLYKDGRLRLTKEVTQMLGFRLRERPQLYVQAFPTGLEVQSLGARQERLTNDASATTIGLHLFGIDDVLEE